MTPATKASPVHEGRVAPPVPWGLLSPTANQEMAPEGRIGEGEHELVQAEVGLAADEGYLQNPRPAGLLPGVLMRPPRRVLLASAAPLDLTADRRHRPPEAARDRSERVTAGETHEYLLAIEDRQIVPRQVVGRISSFSKLGMVGSARPA